MNYSKINGLYIHVPFCDHICSYCDFNKIVASDTLKKEYINCLIKELIYKKKYYTDLESIYIGGGTPSSLPFDLLNIFLFELSKYVNLQQIEEFTIEINPKDININTINNWKFLIDTYNITRISLGVQSFDDNKLKIMNRNHNKVDALNAIDLLHSINFYNINIDLIYGFNETFEDIKKNIDIAISKNIYHLSYYSLILEENTILYHKYLKNEFKEMDDDTEANLYNQIYKYLKTKKFYRYEISNFSYEDSYQSIHNLNTWNNGHYIGIGVSASYYIDNIRYTNTKSIENYIQLINNDKINNIIDEKYELSIKDIMEEEIILGLRKEKGLSLDIFKDKFNKNLFDEFPKITALIDDEYLKIENNFIFISEEFKYLENAIIYKILN